MSRKPRIVIALFILFVNQEVLSKYWRLASVATHFLESGDHRSTCNKLQELSPSQVRLCEQEPRSIVSVILGARVAIRECERLFTWEQWNCTLDDHHKRIHLFKKKTRETAFMHAITSAGVVHAITTACTSGNLTNCSCLWKKYNHAPVESRPSHLNQDTPITHTWGGCSDDVNYGVMFGKKFLDPPIDINFGKRRNRSKKEVKRRLMRANVIIHNNNVGRKVIVNNMLVVCRCHGMSGTCTSKSCWITMPKFSEVSRILKKLYDGAQNISRKERRYLRKRKFVPDVQLPSNKLIYLQASPDHCNGDPKLGLPGTRGRECRYNVTARGYPDLHNCHNVCCGRGFDIKVVEETYNCSCQFIWCCHVKCKSCTRYVDKYYCS